MEEFDIVKWWGASVATIALLWNVYNSLSNAPRLKVKLKSPITYSDSRVISVTKTDHGEVQECAMYCHIEITNTGKLPATVTNIEATHSENGHGRIFSSSQRFMSHSKNTIPMLIAPGELWSCRLEMDDLYCLSKCGKPEIRIEVSYKDKPIVVMPKVPANESSQQDAQKARASA